MHPACDQAYLLWVANEISDLSLIYYCSLVGNGWLADAFTGGFYL
jgi:hypothetical protein